MGKKGKKEKSTGRPDVDKFMKTCDYFSMCEAVNLQETLPFMSSDFLDDFSAPKIAQFLMCVSQIAEWAGTDSPKDYRFKYHHPFLHPVPNFFPRGYKAEVVYVAKTIIEQKTVNRSILAKCPFIGTVADKPVHHFNGKDYGFPQDLADGSEAFLRAVDLHVTKITTAIEPGKNSNFADGLKAFKTGLVQQLKEFDQQWVEYELLYMKCWHRIHSEVFQPIGQLVDIEKRLTEAEVVGAMEQKQQLENELVLYVETLTNRLVEETASHKFPPDVIPLAEACVFYQTKCTEDWLNLCKHVLKDFMELRLLITNVDKDRMKPQYHDNTKFIRLLKQFHKSVIDAGEALEFVSKLPKILYVKTEKWMSKDLLEPEVLQMQANLHKTVPITGS